MRTEVSVHCPRCGDGLVEATVIVSAGEAADYFYPGIGPEVEEILSVGLCSVCEDPIPARELAAYEDRLNELIMDAEFEYDPD